MNNFLTAEIKEISNAVHYRPAVSIIMPFEPKMQAQDELLHDLKIVTDKISRELRNNYPEEITRLMLQKLKSIMSGLHFNTLKKSIAIYVSPVFEKVLYLDIPVEEKIIIDESFEIRDLVYCKKQQHKYLLLVLSSNESKIFLGDNDNLVRMVNNKAAALSIDAPEKVANFSDNTSFKEMQMEKFLHHVDHVLENILNAYHLPLFVMGTKRIAGHFNSLTKHSDAIVEYIHGNYETASLPELADVLQPYIFNWKKVKQTDLLHQLDKAASAGRMVYGIHDVWREATAHKGKLLIVEKDFMYAAEHGSSESIIDAAVSTINSFSCIKDAVDDIIEKILQDGGDVEFTDKDVLKPYDRIALVEYY